MSACDSPPHCLDCDGAQVTFTPAARGADSHAQKKPGVSASRGVSSDAPMSEEDARTHGYTPHATISYDYAFPLSTNKTDDNDLFFSPPPSSSSSLQLRNL